MTRGDRAVVAVVPALAAAALLVLTLSPRARAETILQYFETPWTEIEARMPEIASAGYDALWLPPPTKGSEGTRDVGFAVYDRFDLGDGDADGAPQRGTVPTRYGSKAELISLVETAHRFGVRVYFDVVMNHNGNPNGIENAGVSLDPVELNGFPGTSLWDYHVLPAVQQSNCAGQSNCDFCARQPGMRSTDDFDGAAFGGKQWTALNDDGNYVNATGSEVCMRNGDSGEDRIATLSMSAALAEPGAPSAGNPILAGMTHVLRAPRIGVWDDFEFQVSNWTLVGLHDFCTDQFETSSGARGIDGTCSITGTELPSYVRDGARPETYQYQDPTTPYAEDVRQYLMRWIRWLMLETQADGFRLDAIKHVWPNFYRADFAGDEIAFVKVIQDTYDDLHGFNDADDTDLVDDAAVFGEDFTGSCDALAPYINTGMRALDFPLFFNLGELMSGGDIRKFSGAQAGSCSNPALGAFMGLNRKSGVAFAQSHDECQKNESPDTSSSSGSFSRCFPSGGGRPDLVYAYVLTRDADAAVFFDGNRWTSQSFVRSGRPDGLVEVAGGATLAAVPTLVSAARRMARGSTLNVWVSSSNSDGYVYERQVNGAATGLVVLSDAAYELGWGDGSTTESFIFTTFPPGTELCELTGNALAWAQGCYQVLDPAALGAGEASEIAAARAAFQNGTGAAPPASAGVFYAGVPNSGSSYAVYAPRAYEVGGGGADVVELRDIPTGTLSPGLHALHVRFRRAIAGAADAQDEVVIPLCVPDGSGPALCGTAATASPPSTDPLESGLVELLVDGAAATRRAVETAPARSLPDGRSVAAARAFHVLVDGDALDVVVRTAASLPVDDIAMRIDDDPDLVPGFHLVSTGERFLDRFTKLFPPGVTPPDAGPQEGEGEGEEGEGEGEGEGEPDAGYTPDGDDDGDGVKNADDNCVEVRNADQADFDEDGVGDACDLCVLEGSIEGEQVDGTGCRPVSEDERAGILAIARAIANRESATGATDLDGDADVDVADLEIAIAEAHR
ncbi:MAG: hypothetical protein IT383_19225 [Deltaproteobacteria bacterium]|nr:hypothetical protein [Deltaproteobacteria bacterium]